MWNLQRPDVAEVRSHLDAIFPSDVGPQLAGTVEKDAIEAIYNFYEGSLGRPAPLLLGANLSAILKEAVLDAYSETQNKRKLSALRDTLKLISDICPYCGFGQIQDLDHHLPKAEFKLLSIFPLNLVPCCATCNRNKPRRSRDVAEEHLLNVYLEDLSQYEFLKADVLMDPAAGALQVFFRIEQSAGMSDELVARLVNHFKVYKLQDRYRAQVNIYLGSLEQAFELAFETGGAAGIVNFLNRSAAKNALRFGVNDWHSALLTGLASNAVFCEGGFHVALGARV